MEILKCTTCRKEKEKKHFMNAKNKQLTKCDTCREWNRQWKQDNKKAVSLYNKTYNNNKSAEKEHEYIYAKKSDSDDWIKFDSQLDAAKKLGLHAPNINKVIKGSLKTTGGYMFKCEKEEKHIDKKDWKDVKKENNIEDKCKGKPSKHRVLHETVDEIVGKKCCKCKKWKPLDEYNYSKSHWDNLRNDCKNCLTGWRKDNKETISKKYVEYEKKRKQVDPEFKLLKTLRTRIGSALKRKDSEKSDSTTKLIGCSIPFLKEHLEKQFKEGMTWENHGEWHIDHIKPCASFNVLDKKEQRKCFNYKNLQPLGQQKIYQKDPNTINLMTVILKALK